MDPRSLPWYVDGFDLALNLRDLGGWTTMDGRIVKRGHIFRSARLFDASDAELVRLMKLGISHVVDLRPREEAALFPDPKLPSIRFVFADVGRDVLVDDDVVGLTPQELVGLAAAQTSAMAFGNQGAATILTMLEQGNEPLLFHCNTGRDRSGVAAMIVLMALGCADDVLLADYLLTNWYRADALSVLRDRYAKLVGEDDGYDDLLTLLAGVHSQVGEAVLEEIDKRYPSREAYLEAEYGFDETRLAALREKLTS